MIECSTQPRLDNPRRWLRSPGHGLSLSWVRWLSMLVITTMSFAASAEAESDEKAEGQPEASTAEATGQEATEQTSPSEPGKSLPSQAACLAAHQKAQAMKRNTQFIEALEQLMICSSASCPGIVISDCGEWIGELDRRTPSLAFSVKEDGKEAPAALVTLDGKPVTDLSQVVKVNPGRHVVRVELAPFPPREEVVFARDGAGTQVVRVEFETPSESEPAPIAAGPMTPGVGPASTPVDEWERPVPTMFYPLAALSVVGFGGFAGFAYIGNTRQQELEDECEPDCEDDELKPMKNSYLISDISLAVGAASLLGAAVVYWTRPSKLITSTEPSLSVRVEPTFSANASGLGVSAVHTW